jgi:hypothetical protein
VPKHPDHANVFCQCFGLCELCDAEEIARLRAEQKPVRFVTVEGPPYPGWTVHDVVPRTKEALLSYQDDIKKVIEENSLKVPVEGGPDVRVVIHDVEPNPQPMKFPTSIKLGPLDSDAPVVHGVEGVTEETIRLFRPVEKKEE